MTPSPYPKFRQLISTIQFRPEDDGTFSLLSIAFVGMDPLRLGNYPTIEAACDGLHEFAYMNLREPGLAAANRGNRNPLNLWRRVSQTKTTTILGNLRIEL